MKTPKKISYGQCSFERLRTENYVYVDKTRFIEMLENEPNSYHFLIRPRKFGKSLFLSTLRCYYDICYADKFDEYFGDLYIGKNPTQKRNSYLVIEFNFSGLDTSSVETFQDSFKKSIKNSIEFFLTEHKFILADYDENLKELRKCNNIHPLLSFAFNIISSFGRKAYITIDDYDQYVSNLIAGTEQNKELSRAFGIVRNFYEILKNYTADVIDTIFMTGVMPIVFDNLTSGFNITTNLSNDLRYNDIYGFTEEEVEFLIEECGIDRTKMTIDLKSLFSGYLFHQNAKNKLYNPSMVLYFLSKSSIADNEIEKIVDDNFIANFEIVKILLDKPENNNQLDKIFKSGTVPTIINKRFSIDDFWRLEFLSLLYYVGLVTFDDDNERGISYLKIPNDAIKLYLNRQKRKNIQK